MDEHLRRKVLQHPERYPDEYLRQASEGEDVLQADREKLRDQYGQKHPNRNGVAEMILHHNRAEVAPHLQELYQRTDWLLLPWWKRAWARLRVWWEDLWAEESAGSTRDRAERAE